MRSPGVFPLFFFVVIFYCSNAMSTNIVDETCKRCAEKDPNLSYNFCVASLGAVPRSHCTSLRGLGMISLKLTRQNVTKTTSYIKGLLKKKKKWLDPFVRACLRDCLDLYSDAVPAVKQAIGDYKAKQYQDANIGVSSVVDASSTCEDGFFEKQGAVSPLTKRNNDTFQLSVISLSIINMLATSLPVTTNQST